MSDHSYLLLMKKILLIVGWITVTAGGLASCATDNRNATSVQDGTIRETKMIDTETIRGREMLYGAQETQQIIVDGDYMRIGVGNLMNEEYEKADGTTKTGTTAGLWFFFRELSEFDEVRRVYEGQEFEILQHNIRIVEIDSESGLVEIGITPPEE